MAQAELLNQLSVLSDLSPSQVETLAPLAREVSFEQDEIILRASHPSKYLYVLLSGCVRVEVKGKAFSYCIQELGPGQVFGWSSLLGQHDTLFQVRARDVSNALRLDGAQLRALVKTDPELEAKLLRKTLQVAADRIEATETKLGQLFGLEMSSHNGETGESTPGARR